MPEQPEVVLRIEVIGPPAGVVFAMQRGRDELVPPISISTDALLFEFSVRVADLNAQPPRLLGPFVQGPVGARFVYINSETLAGHAKSCWTRRAKVPLFGIAKVTLESALAQTGSVLQASIRGTARDGGPACASVPLLRDWTLDSGRATPS
jgi:hypothetical protein